MIKLVVEGPDGTRIVVAEAENFNVTEQHDIHDPLVHVGGAVSWEYTTLDVEDEDQ